MRRNVRITGHIMEIYLDNAATTACSPEVAEIVQQAMLTDFGNPSSLHRKGIEAEKHLRQATSTLAGILKCKEKEIFFTSGGTESNNWAILGGAHARARSGKHVITTAIEHPSVAEPFHLLEEEGFEVTVLPVDARGLVTADQVAEAMRPDTTLISVMMVNNEIGTILPVAEIGETIHRKNADVLFHVDAVQAFGKQVVHPAAMHIDLLSVSGHKIHGPKGIGILYVRDGARIRPMLLGGGQQKGMRSGTDNVPGMAGLACAAEKAYAGMQESVAQMRRCQARLIAGLLEMENVVIHGACAGEEGRSHDPGAEREHILYQADAAPHIVNASFLGIRSEVLLHALEEKEIFVSSGSACSSHKRTPSAVLTAIGCRKEEIESAIRFSFSGETTEEEIDTTVQALRELVPVLRRFVRK